MHVAARELGDGIGSKSRAQQMLNTEIYGSPRYCLAEVLDYLAQLIQVRQLHIVKSEFI